MSDILVVKNPKFFSVIEDSKKRTNFTRRKFISIDEKDFETILLNFSTKFIFFFFMKLVSKEVSQRRERMKNIEFRILKFSGLLTHSLSLSLSLSLVTSNNYTQYWIAYISEKKKRERKFVNVFINSENNASNYHNKV